MRRRLRESLNSKTQKIKNPRLKAGDHLVLTFRVKRRIIKTERLPIDG